MNDTPEDPVDHSRTARRLTGEALKDIRTSPGLLCSALGVVALMSGLDLLAVGHAAAATLAGSIAIAAGGVGAVWVLADRRRLVRHQVRWLSEHPDAKPEPPTG